MNPLQTVIVLSSEMLNNKSRCRRQQDQWMKKISQQFEAESGILDLGGVRDADYHRMLAPNANWKVWNFDDDSKPDAKVDLDHLDSYPQFPKTCDTIVAYNLLEHLFRPIDLIQWSAKNLPSKGKLVISVPYLYRVHPSPKDYWRLTPQVFEKVFQDLSSQGINGKFEIESLGDDLRDLVSPVTADLFKGTRLQRWAGNLIEGSASLATGVLGVLGQRKQIKRFAQMSPVAIGVLWIKD